MSDRELILNHYRHVQHNRVPINNVLTVKELDAVLNAAAATAAHIFSVETGEDRVPALLTVGDSGEATFYRVTDAKTLEALTCPLAGGVLTETFSLYPDNDEHNAGLRKITYSSPGLVEIGGYFTIDCRYGTHGDRETIRSVFAPMTLATLPDSSGSREGGGT